MYGHGKKIMEGHVAFQSGIASWVGKRWVGGLGGIFVQGRWRWIWRDVGVIQCVCVCVCFFGFRGGEG